MLDATHLARIMRQAARSRIDAFAQPLADAMARFAIDANVQRAAAFIAQLAHESGQFRYMEEIWGPTDAQKRYEPPGTLARRLGNTERGDGFRFKGRGPIQVTGRFNYKRYGDELGIDLIAAPEQAARPDVGFALAGLFWDRNRLNALADRGDFDELTRRINGGHNGLEDRKAFYQRALQVLAPVFPPVPARAARPARSEAAAGEPFERGAEAVRELAPPPKAKAPAVRKLPKLDARPDTVDFRDTMYVPTLIEVPTHIPLGDYLAHGVPVLDQGTEGACTGFGLATVANYLLKRRKVLPDRTPVSARMLYLLARRYDEWPGEDYEGSSARGAMKGWHKHGVCPEALYPSRGKDDRKGLTDSRTSEARRRPLGAYFRVNHKDVIAMHSAIAEVGILYATCVVHEGWQSVGADGVIHPSEQVLGGHAFAIVAYDDLGFWLQNSWGTSWGMEGFAHVSYDDWLANGTDVWVARLGAPVTLRTAQSTATAHAAGAGQSAAYSFSDLRPHIVSVGNDGKLRAGGEYGVTPDSLRQVFEDDIPRVTAGWKKRRILLYAHGGLVSEKSAAQRLADYRPALLEREIYPLAFIWKTDYWTTLGNMLQDAVRRRRPEGFLDAAKDFMLDRLDDALEPLARVLTGKASWDEMKENALAASATGGAAHFVARQLEAMAGPDVEVHLVGHSAGSILLAPLVQQLARRGLPIQTCTLWAPACTTQLFEQHYLPAIQAGQIQRMALYVLSDKAEQDDHCARIYNKSLLYMVSNAFEKQPRIPGFRDGQPILGMERWLTKELRALFDGQRHQLVVAPNQFEPSTGLASEARAHGAFDDDQATVMSTFLRILGASGPKVAVATAEAAMNEVAFHRSATSLRDRRQEIDMRSSTGARGV